MANTKTAIEWTATINPDGTVTPGASWNPVTGCSHVSPGCQNCYAETLSHRFGWTTKPWGAQYAAENVMLHPERLEQPLKWRKPKKIFVNSMSDLFHEQVPDEFIAAVFGVMAACPHHTFQILTKRPERMLKWFAKVEVWADQSRASFGDDTFDWRRWQCLVGSAIRQIGSGRLSGACSGLTPWPLRNVWLGVSVEDQPRADERIPLLLQCPSAVRFLSCEPLLDEIDLSQWLDVNHQVWVEKPEPHSQDGWHLAPHPVTGIIDWYPGISWVICGGESGPGFRPMDIDWARSVRDQCQAAGVAFFFKQIGGVTPKSRGRLLDARLWNEFPEVSHD